MQILIVPSSNLPSRMSVQHMPPNGWRYPLVGGIGHHPGALPGRDHAVLPEPTPSHVKCLKTRSLPPPHLHLVPVQVWPRCSSGIGCTLCWHTFVMASRPFPM